MRCTEVPTEHCKIKVVNGIPVNGKAEIIAALGKPPAGEHGGALFEFALGVNKYRKAELLRDEGEKLFEEKQYEAAMSLLIDAGNLYVPSHTPPLHAVLRVACGALADDWLCVVTAIQRMLRSHKATGECGRRYSPSSRNSRSCRKGSRKTTMTTTLTRTGTATERPRQHLQTAGLRSKY